MTGEQLLKLQEKISADNVDSFYHWKDWEQLRAEVLRMDNHECQIAKGQVSQGGHCASCQAFEGQTRPCVIYLGWRGAAACQCMQAVP